MNINSIILLIGGLGLFLFGMKYMGEGLELAAGPKMKDLLETLTRNRLMGLLLGALVTVIIQSSSATTVMAMGFINAGIMDLAQATGVIFGANIGTTITSILIALDVSGIAPVCIGCGAILMLYAKKKRTRYIGQVILGFGLLFEGLHTMSGAMSPLKDFAPFQTFIMNAKNPVLGFLLGAVLCTVIQSSSASVGVLQALSMQGLMPLSFAGYIICGINVGSSAPVLLAALNAKNNAKRAAIIYLLFNVFGTILFIPLSMLTPLTSIIAARIPNGMFQISCFHIMFKAVTAVVLLPLVNLVVKWTYRLVPKQAHEDAFRLEYIDPNLVGSPAVLQLQITKEVERMAASIKTNLEQASKGLVENSMASAQEIRDRGDLINYLASEILPILNKVNTLALPASVSNYLGCAFNVINDLKQMGDHTLKILAQIEKNIDAGIDYTDEAKAELMSIYQLDSELMDWAMQVFHTTLITQDEWAKIRKQERTVSIDIGTAQTNHLKRMKQHKCTFDQGVTFVEAMNSYQRIANHSVSIAGAVGNESITKFAQRDDL